LLVGKQRQRSQLVKNLCSSDFFRLSAKQPHRPLLRPEQLIKQLLTFNIGEKLIFACYNIDGFVGAVGDASFRRHYLLPLRGGGTIHILVLYIIDLLRYYLFNRYEFVTFIELDKSYALGVSAD